MLKGSIVLLLLVQAAFGQGQGSVGQADEDKAQLSRRLIERMTTAKDDEAVVRKVLLTVLGNEIIGAEVAGAVLPMVRDSRYSDHLRALAAEASARTCPERKIQVRDAVEQELWCVLRTDRSEYVRAAAARSLGWYNIRTRNPKVVETLLAASADTSAVVRQGAYLGLGGVRIRRADAVTRLTEALGSDHAKVQRQYIGASPLRLDVLRALSRQGPFARGALPGVRSILDGKDDFLAIEAAGTLLRIGVKGDRIRAETHLLEFVEPGPLELRRGLACHGALGKLTLVASPKRDTVLSVGSVVTDSKDSEELVMSALETLSRWGPEAIDALGALELKLEEEESAFMRQQIESTCERIRQSAGSTPNKKGMTRGASWKARTRTSGS